LERVTFAAVPPRGATARSLWALTVRSGPGGLRRFRNPGSAKRPQLVEALHRFLGDGPGDDPALRALTDEERRDLRRRDRLAPARQGLQRHLRGLRRKLLGFQRDALRKFASSGRLVLADDMGLGKTTQAVAAVHLLARAGIVRKALVVAPAALKHQWEAEWRATTDLDVTIVEGGPEERARAYQGPGCLIANYEQLFRDVDVVRDWAPDLVILDEGQRIKNWATRTARVVKQLRPEFRIVLTGTPFENRISELDSILEWVDRRPLQPLWRLGPVHGLGDRAGASDLRGLDVLRERLDPVLLRRRRADVLGELPERTDHVTLVEMTAAQIEAHEALAEQVAKLVARTERRPLTQQEFLRLMSLLTTQRIVANGLAQVDFAEFEAQLAVTRPTDRVLASLDAPKLGAIRDLIEALVVEQGRKVVVFSQWRRMLRLVEWACGPMLRRHQLGVAHFVGGQSARRRRAAVLEFHDDPDVPVLFATDAGGVGLNLQRAATACIHCDVPWNPAVF
jgi:SNF2 family DNA or RNA helicase